MDVSEADVYDVILTKAEIQECLDLINTMVKKEIAAAKREAFFNATSLYLSTFQIKLLSRRSIPLLLQVIWSAY